MYTFTRKNGVMTDNPEIHHNVRNVEILMKERIDQNFVVNLRGRILSWDMLIAHHFPHED